MSIKLFKQDFESLRDPKRVPALQRFFKTGPGEYAEGDVFYGLTVPTVRKLAKKYQDLTLNDLHKMIQSPIHEERLAAIIILVNQFSRSDEAKRKKIFDFYLSHTPWINHWDLVDVSAEPIIGAYLEGQDKDLLMELARSKNLWERRMAMMATFYYIKRGEPFWTLKMSAMLLTDPHDLIHKAAGWMLREVGKRCSLKVEESFLRKHYLRMPRTMLRYAIEKFPEKKRKFYLTKS